MNKNDETTSVHYTLQDLKTIRQRSQQILDLACQNKLKHFEVDLKKIPETAAFVVNVIYDQYPDLAIPYHSRWRHFEAEQIDRIKILRSHLHTLSPEEQGRILYELVIISVLLDAGAGKHWHYTEASTGLTLCRSEGLAVASLELYLSGAFSSQPEQPLRVDGERLLAFNQKDLMDGFQVNDSNPLEGLQGRLTLLKHLGENVINETRYFGNNGRLGDFYLYVISLKSGGSISAAKIFQAVLTAFTEVWPKRLQFCGVSLGDVWAHQLLKSSQPGSEFIPFHKLSQWLTYSLIEPLEQFGIPVIDIDDLTGLPEYRNGGLLIDSGLLRLKDQTAYEQYHEPGSELIIEWRALTVALLDELAKTIREQLGVNLTKLPLAKILQGGTWEAGRRIAKLKRSEGTPPLQIISDGTIF